MPHDHPLTGLLIFLFVLLLTGCTRHSSTDRMMDHVDSLITYHGDSLTEARSLLSRSRKDWEQFSKRQRMRWLLLDAKLQNKAFIPFTTGTTMKAVAEYYDHHGSANEKMEAWYLLGCVYRDLGDAPQAIDILNKAEACADTTSVDCDYLTLSRICSQKDELYVGLMMPRGRLRELKKGIHYAILAKDTFNAIALYNQEYSAYLQLENIDSAIIVNEKSAEMFNRKGYYAEAAMAIGGNINSYIIKGRLNDARKAIWLYETKAGLFHQGIIDKRKVHFYNLKGNYFLSVNRLDSAEYYFRMQLQSESSDLNQYEASRSLAELYDKESNADSAAKYSFKALDLNDSISKNLETAKVIQINKLYNYNSIRNKWLESEREAASLKIQIFIIALIIIVILLVIYIFYKKRIEIKLIKARQIESDYTGLLSTLNKEYEQVLNDNSFPEESHEQRISILKKMIDDYNRILHTDGRKEANTKLRNSNIYLRFMNLRKKGKTPKEEDWKELEEYLYIVIPQFHQIIDPYNRLSEEEYRICVLTRYKFQPMDIGFFISCYYHSNINISTKRSRLLEKIWGKKGNGKEFDRMINEIS